MALPCASSDGKKLSKSRLIRPHKQFFLRTFLWESSPLLPRAALYLSPCEGAWLSADDEPPENEKKINIRFIYSGKRDKNVPTQYYFFLTLSGCVWKIKVLMLYTERWTVEVLFRRCGGSQVGGITGHLLGNHEEYVFSRPIFRLCANGKLVI